VEVRLVLHNFSVKALVLVIHFRLNLMGVEAH
jgi:hypothetical protein